MINLIIKRNDDLGNTPLIYHFYDDINRIPLEIIFDKNSKYREGINIDNYDEKTYSFITLKFDKITNVLCNITFVSINEENIIYKEFTKSINDVGGKYLFYINKFDIRTNYETKLVLDSDNNSILIYFDNFRVNELSFYSADKNLSLGVDLHNNLKGIFLKNLDMNNIKRFLNI